MSDEPRADAPRPTIAALRQNMSSDVVRRWRNLDPANGGKSPTVGSPEVSTSPASERLND